MADSATRRVETIALNWGDVETQSGLVRIARRKGGKDHSVVIGANVCHALLRYRRTLKDHTDHAPLFQTKNGGRFSRKGFREIFVRLSKRSGIQVNAHSLRRTWAILCLRACMEVLHLQALGGWASLELVNHYAQMVDADLLHAHRTAYPTGNLGRLRKG